MRSREKSYGKNVKKDKETPKHNVNVDGDNEGEDDE